MDPSVTVDLATVDPARMRSIFDANGFVVCAGLLGDADLVRYRDGLAALMRARLRALDVQAPAGPPDLDALYRVLVDADPDARFELRTVAKEHLVFHEFIAHPRIREALRVLIGHEHLHVNEFQNLVRIDAPGRDQEGFAWHQDYAYNVMSRSTITAWAPLTLVSPEMGCLRVVPGSHRTLHEVDLSADTRVPRYTHQNRLRIRDYERKARDFDAAAVDAHGIAPGDVLIFHSHLVHASGPNRSTRNRWVFNARFGDILDDALVARRWKAARAGNLYPVVEVHPEKARLVDAAPEPD